MKDWSRYDDCERGTPSLTYTATSDGSGLEVFGTTTEKLAPRKDALIAKLEEEHDGCGPVDVENECLDLFVASADAPTTAELKYGTTASGGRSNSLGEERGHRGLVVIPIAQGPIAAMLSLPAGCKIQKGSKLDLNNVTLGQIFEAKRAPGSGDPGGVGAQNGYVADTWGALLSQLGYARVANESELSSGKFTEGTPEETLTRYKAGSEEEVKTATREEVEKGESETVKVANQAKVNVKGSGCTQAITAQVPASESGTAYAFKAYLNQVNKTVWEPFVTDAITWPELSAMTEQNPTTSEKPNSKGELELKNETDDAIAENTSANPGSIGFADTADAALQGAFGEAAIPKSLGTGELEEVVEEEVENKAGTGKVKIKTLEKVKAKSISHQILWAQAQNTGTKAAPNSSEYVNPLQAGEAHTTNCETNLILPVDEYFPKHWNRSWFGTLVSDPDITSHAGIPVTAYPLCALTYDVAWHHYRNGNLYGHEGGAGGNPTELAEEMAKTAKDYFEYVLGQGQEDLASSGYYVSVPRAMRPFIKAAVANIGY